MRLAPVAVRWWNDEAALFDAARRQSRTTHAAPAAVDVCAAFAAMLTDAIAGAPASSAFRSRGGEFTPRLSPPL